MMRREEEGESERRKTEERLDVGNKWIEDMIARG